jgi:uncharacterized OB-fold protein
MRPAWSRRRLQNLDDGAFLRGHRCADCGRVFLTVQRVIVDAEDVEKSVEWTAD